MTEWDQRTGLRAISRNIPRYALITGAATRVGRAIAFAVAGAGFDVAVHYNVSREDAEETVGEIRRMGRHAVALPGNLEDRSATEKVVPHARSLIGPIGLLVNNASIFVRDEWHDATALSWDRHMEINLHAPFVLTQRFAKQLPAESNGLVVNVVDQRVWSLTPHYVSYTASKAGLWAVTQSLALALAPRIRVNAIGPGPTLRSTQESEAEFQQDWRAVPLEHGTTPDEIGTAIVSLLALPSVTGQMLAMDGGQHMHWGPAPRV